MLTPFGKKCGKILIIVIVLICIIQFIAQYKPYTAPNFILVDKGGPEKPAYALSPHNEKSGYYKVECSSGCGDVKINDKIYYFKNENAPDKKQYANYVLSTTLYLSADTIVSATSDLDDINFIVKFYFIKGK